MPPTPDQIRWSNFPSDENTPVPYQLVRVPKTGISGLLVLSEEPIGCETHFANGRTSPCVGAACAICAENQRPRWAAWLGVLAIRQGTVLLLEITAAAAVQAKTWLEEHGSLRGANLQAYRRPKRPNGRLVLELSPSGRTEAEIPQAPDVIRILERIWGIHQHNAAAAADATISERRNNYINANGHDEKDA